MINSYPMPFGANVIVENAGLDNDNHGEVVPFLYVSQWDGEAFAGEQWIEASEGSVLVAECEEIGIYVEFR